MKKLFAKLSLLAILLSPFLSFANPVLATNTAKFYFTSTKTTYSVGEPIYIKLRVNPGVEQINVARAIFNWNNGVATYVDKTLDGAWPYPSPGSTVDTGAPSINQGGFLLASAVTTDSQFMTIQFVGAAPGTLTLNFDPASLLVDIDMNNQLNGSLLQSYSVQIGAVTPPPPPPPPVPVNHPPVINDIGEKIGNTGQNLNFTVTTSDPDGDLVTLTASGMPTGATLSGNVFNWTSNQQGISFVIFTATDNSPLGPLSTNQTTRITIFSSTPIAPSAPGGAVTSGPITLPAISEVAPIICPVASTGASDYKKISTVRSNPNIYSPSHPDQDKWYSISLVDLNWEKDPVSLGYAMVFDKLASSDPNASYYNLTDSQITYRDVPDGRWYFHLKVRYEDGWSQTYSFRVNVDTVAPSLIITSAEGPSKVSLNGEDKSQAGKNLFIASVGSGNNQAEVAYNISDKSQAARIFFVATDLESGIDRYEYRVDQGTWTTVINPLTLPEFNADQVVGIRAIDKASNVAESDVSLKTFKITGDTQDYVIFAPHPSLITPVISQLVTHEVSSNFLPSHVLIFTGTAEPLSQINLYIAGSDSIIGSGETNSSGVFKVTVDTYIPSGNYKFVARSIKSDLVSSPSNPVSIKLDTAVYAAPFPWTILALGGLIPIFGYLMYRAIRLYSKPEDYRHRDGEKHENI